MLVLYSGQGEKLLEKNKRQGHYSRQYGNHPLGMCSISGSQVSSQMVNLHLR